MQSYEIIPILWHLRAKIIMAVSKNYAQKLNNQFRYRKISHKMEAGRIVLCRIFD